MKTIAVKNKAIAMQLINNGFELLNVTKSRDDGKSCFIFEKTDALKARFDKLAQNTTKLTDAEKQFIFGLLGSKRTEYINIGVSTDIIDSVIKKFGNL